MFKIEKGEDDLKIKLSTARDRVFELQEENAKACDELRQLALRNVVLVGTRNKEVRQAKKELTAKYQ